MLNLDINEKGVSFSKGCYPGQEVVARLHYLGSAKRRLFAFKSDEEMQVGDSLYCQTSKACLLYTSPSPRDGLLSRMPSSA